MKGLQRQNSAYDFTAKIHDIIYPTYEELQDIFPHGST